MKDLIIINNEKIFKENNNFYCDNAALKFLPEGLNYYYQVKYIVRSSNKKKEQKIDLENIKASSNIIKFIYFVFKTFKIPNATYLLISITPYTFFSFLFLFLFRKKRIFVYLFSSGHEEYKHILGNWSVWIFDLMYRIITSNSKVLVCHERLYNKKKSHLVHVSRLDEEWLQDHKEVLLDKIRLLYVGRISAEKGIFNFIKMFDEIKTKFEFSIVGNLKKYKLSNNNINLINYVSDTKKLINIYDRNNITILPSYTEGSPNVVNESLSRKRPVIIFEDIDYIIKDKKGIFVSKRDPKSFSETAKNIIDNYGDIQKEMEKNVLPTKKNMIKQISDIIESEVFN
jgi:glycosyltransferase involved in cell wall biosynthesis|tara:strand:- start:985 stop:2010 length:1026 start_codon:yes stop_codon:yes gene_type:complete